MSLTAEALEMKGLECVHFCQAQLRGNPVPWVPIAVSSDSGSPPPSACVAFTMRRPLEDKVGREPGLLSILSSGIPGVSKGLCFGSTCWPQTSATSF